VEDDAEHMPSAGRRPAPERHGAQFMDLVAACAQFVATAGRIVPNLRGEHYDDAERSVSRGLDRRPRPARPCRRRQGARRHHRHLPHRGELRTTLEVLRADGPDTAGPLPDLTALPGLVRAAQADLDVRTEEAHIPPAVEAAAYRIVQESLTNSLRH
jgi:hypothetical protein